MKRKVLFFAVVFLSVVFLAGVQSHAENIKIILLVSEQNIDGPRHAWWASEVDLSIIEARIAQGLVERGYMVLEPSALNQIIKQERGFRIVDMAQVDSVALGNLSQADYVVVGKAVATAGSNVPSSSMRSCFANVTAKVIRVKDGSVVAYLDAAGNSAHMDVISGGREALARAGEMLAVKIGDVLHKQESQEALECTQ